MAAASEEVEVVLSLKFFIYTKGQRVLFAEADKKVVDTLFQIIALPMGTIIKLLIKQQIVMPGCLGNLYDNVENLGVADIQPNRSKDMLLKPTFKPISRVFPATLFPANCEPVVKVVYRCSYSYNQSCFNFSAKPSAPCPSCGSYMTFALKYVAPTPADLIEADRNYNKEVENGFLNVKGTYIVMDDLEVTPITAFALLNKLNTAAAGSLHVEEKAVDLGINEVLKLLKTSMISKKVLSTVFLKGIDKE